MKCTRGGVGAVTSWSGEFKYLFPSHSYQALRKFFLSIGIPTLSPGNIRSSFCEFLLHLPSTHPSYEARHELQSSAAHSAAAGGSVILRHYTKKAKLQLGFQLHDLVVQDFINPAIVEANKLLSSSFPLQEKSIQYPLASDSSDSSLFDIHEAEASNSPRELGTGYRLVSKKRKLSYTSQPHEFMIEGPTRLSSTNMDSLPKGFKAALKTSLQIIFRKNYLSCGSSGFVSMMQDFIRAHWTQFFAMPFVEHSKNARHVFKLTTAYATRSFKNCVSWVTEKVSILGSIFKLCFYIWK